MITKQEYANIDKMSDLLIKYGMDFKQMRTELTKLGLFKEYHNAFIEKQYEKMRNDKKFMEKVDQAVVDNVSYKRICSMRGYTYKAIEKYLEEISYIEYEIEDNIIEQYKNEIEVISNHYENVDKLRFAKEVIRDAVLESGVSCNFGPFKADVVMANKTNAISKARLIKEFGENKVKQIFPELFEKELKVQFARK